MKSRMDRVLAMLGLTRAAEPEVASPSTTNVLLDQKSDASPPLYSAPSELSEEQWRAFRQVESSDGNLLITGVAGTGKSHLLQYFAANTSKERVVVAPTGVAALKARGQTIHSLFGFRPAFLEPEDIKVDRLSHKLKGILRNLDTLVIDEISMVRADLLEAMHRVMCAARESDSPFGGLQVIAFGDPFQLPPVVGDKELHKYFADHWGGAFFFNAPVWGAAAFANIELTQTFRQTESAFIELLNSVRTGSITSEQLQKLNERVTDEEDIPQTRTITLVGNNSVVTEINSKRLRSLPGLAQTYLANVTGEIRGSSFPTEFELVLKPGAQVILVRNDLEKRWLNGLFGTISSANDEELVVRIDEIDHQVRRETWRKIKYVYNRGTRRIEEEVVGEFTQFPVRLAWAITVHKSQGSTFDSVAVDLRDGAFAHGQSYVGLSRCTSLSRLYLLGRIYRDDIIVDPAVVAFAKNLSRSTLLDRSNYPDITGSNTLDRM